MRKGSQGGEMSSRPWQGLGTGMEVPLGDGRSGV